MRDYAGKRYFDYVRPNTWGDWLVFTIVGVIFTALALLSIPK